MPTIAPGGCLGVSLKFTVLSHAGLYAEHAGVRIVMDPWLTGSCYWRSWWNFPEPPADLCAELAPDYLYLTHLHWDHFHGISLKKFFAPWTRILVPKVPTRRMLADLQWLGFHDVVEIPHGGSVQLGPDFTLHSYQFGPAVDSTAALTAGGRTLLNCNDCKSFGLPLAQILKRHPKIDFLLRSHSSAAPLPHCAERHAELFPDFRSQQDYIDEFSRFALHVGARHAIPFASNHCFLHRDTFQFNRTSVSPEDVRRHYQRVAAEAGSDSACVVMAPGSSWSERGGFELVEFDYTKREQHVQAMLERHQPQLLAQYEREEQTFADFGAFETYFRELLRAVPWLVRRWCGFRIVFRTRDPSGEHNWLVDVKAGTVTVVDCVEPDCVVLETPALVLNDCARTRMFSVWGASKRLKLRLPSAPHVRVANTLFTLLDLFELETLPLWKNFTPRALSVRLRRWREAVELARVLFSAAILRRRFQLVDQYRTPARARPG